MRRNSICTEIEMHVGIFVDNLLSLKHSQKSNNNNRLRKKIKKHDIYAWKNFALKSICTSVLWSSLFSHVTFSINTNSAWVEVDRILCGYFVVDKKITVLWWDSVLRLYIYLVWFLFCLIHHTNQTDRDGVKINYYYQVPNSNHVLYFKLFFILLLEVYSHWP